MPTLQATTMVTQEVILKPSVRRRLLTELKAYADLKMQIHALQVQMDFKKANIADLREGTGEKAIAIDGFKITLVEPVRSALDKKALLEAGVSMAQLEAGTLTKPTKPYTKVTVPGDKDSE